MGLDAGPVEELEKRGLVWGLVALIGGFVLFLPFLLGMVAIHYGRASKRLGGNGTGIFLGWLSLTLFFAFLVFAAVALMLFFWVINNVRIELVS